MWLVVLSEAFESKLLKLETIRNVILPPKKSVLLIRHGVS